MNIKIVRWIETKMLNIDNELDITVASYPMKRVRSYRNNHYIVTHWPPKIDYRKLILNLMDWNSQDFSHKKIRISQRWTFIIHTMHYHPSVLELCQNISISVHTTNEKLVTFLRKLKKETRSLAGLWWSLQDGDHRLWCRKGFPAISNDAHKGFTGWKLTWP